MPATTIQTFELPELPGKPMFRCSKLSMTLQVRECVRMWETANGPRQCEQWFACRNCSQGSVNAGRGVCSPSRYFGMVICARCHKTGTRMVLKDLCVSCWNRQREYLIGRNAKGQKPVKHPQLGRSSIQCLVDDGGKVRAETVERAYSVSNHETVLARLRDDKKLVGFAFFGGV